MMHKEIITFNRNVFEDVVKLVSESGEKEFNVQLNKDHPTLANALNYKAVKNLFPLYSEVGGA